MARITQWVKTATQVRTH